MPGNNYDESPHRGGPINVQHVIGQAFPQRHKGHPLCLSYGRQIPYRKWGRKGPRDQWIARECYLASMKQKAVDNIHADEIDMRDELDIRPTPSEELEPVQLDYQPEHLAYIRFKLNEDVRDPLIHFLKQNVEVFAWKQEDMGGIDPTIITHKLNVSPFFKPIKQKRRSFALERQKEINEEVSKLLQARAI